MAEPGSSAEESPRPEDEEGARLEARLLRHDAAIRRTEAGVERAAAAGQRGDAADERSERIRDEADRGSGEQAGIDGSKADEPESVTSRREAMADERERIANQREAEADERDHIADDREVQADLREQSAAERDDSSERLEGRLRQWEVGVIRSDRAMKQAADEREAQLNERERVLRQEEAQLDERERIAEQNELAKEMDRSAAVLRRMSTGEGELSNLTARGAALRARAASLADRIADQAEQFAANLQVTAERGDRDRRLAIAETELEIARIERQNAAKLRDQGTPFKLEEHLPRLPGADSEVT